MIEDDVIRGVRAARARAPAPRMTLGSPADLERAVAAAVAGFEAIRNSTLAGPVGSRRPCSQFCNVSWLMPSNVANLDCDSPSLPRAFTTSFLGSSLNVRTWPMGATNRSGCEIVCLRSSRSAGERHASPTPSRSA
jgi:hypothetical protein